MRTAQLAEIDVLIRARYPILYIVSWEEERVEEALWQIAREHSKRLFVWPSSSGMVPRHLPAENEQNGPREAENRRPARKEQDERTRDPLMALSMVMDHVEPAIFVLRDLHPYLNDADRRSGKGVHDLGVESDGRGDAPEACTARSSSRAQSAGSSAPYGLRSVMKTVGGWKRC